MEVHIESSRAIGAGKPDRGSSWFIDIETSTFVDVETPMFPYLQTCFY